MQNKIVVIVHNVRSCHNVGAILRTADAFAIERVFLTGYTPYPSGAPDDERLPHIANNATKLIHKTALGAEQSVEWRHQADVDTVIKELKDNSYTVAAIEQHSSSSPLPNVKSSEKIALLVGREVEGVEQDVLKSCDQIIEIPMFGAKESLNVAHAAAVAMYHCRFIST